MNSQHNPNPNPSSKEYLELHTNVRDPSRKPHHTPKHWLCFCLAALDMRTMYHTWRDVSANLDGDSCETQHKQDKRRSGAFAVAVTRHVSFPRFDVATVQNQNTHTQIAFSLSFVTLLISLFNLETSLRALLICDWPFPSPHFTWGEIPND